jgi:hypothetical protein
MWISTLAPDAQHRCHDLGLTCNGNGVNPGARMLSNPSVHSLILNDFTTYPKLIIFGDIWRYIP